MIAIIDYGVGNVRAFVNIYRSLDIDVILAKNPSDLKSASKIILPGVGAFDWAMEKLNNTNLLDKLNFLVLEKCIPILGVCVGMQMMANTSDEGKLSGLGWLDGQVKHLSNLVKDENLPLPHMGWSNVKTQNNSVLFEGLDSFDFYFLHSYYFAPRGNNYLVGSCNYGMDFACALEKDNIFATQFHPEKSHQAGVQVLKNFYKIG